MADRTVIVGQIAIKVTPNTKGFKQTLRRQLKKIEDTTKAVQIKLGLDEEGLVAKVKAAAARAEKQAEDITLKLNVDSDRSVRNAINAVERELERLGEEDYKIGLNVDELNDALDYLKNFKKIELDFDPKSKRDVERALQSIDDELSKLKRIKIDVDLDEESLTAMHEMLSDQLGEMEEEVRLQVRFDDDPTSLRRALGQVESELEKLRPPRIDVALDEESLRKVRDDLKHELDMIEQEHSALKLFEDNIKRQDIRKMVDRIDRELQRLKIRPGVDLRDFDRGMRTIEQKLWDIKDLEAKLTVDLDERTRRETEHKIKNLRDEVEDIEANIAVDVSSGSYQMVKAQLAYLARTRVVSIVPEVSKTAAVRAGTALAALTGTRLVYDRADKFLNRLLNLDKEILNVITLGSAFFTIASSTAASASNLFAIAGGLASMAPLALSLPGIFGGMAIGAGVTFAALKDINEVLPELKTRLSEMQDSISKNFWSEAKQPIKEMADKLLPKLKDGFDKVATAAGDWFGSFSTEIAQALVPAIDGMFKNLEGSIGIFKDATKPIAEIITHFGNMGSVLLPRIATRTKEWLETFNDWLDRIQKDGTWGRWVGEGLQAFKDLGRILKETFGILQDISRVAKDSGGAGLGTLADTLERIHEVTSGKRFQEGLGNFFKGGHEFFEAFSKASDGALGDLLYELSRTFLELAPEVGQVLGELGKIIGEELASPATQQAIKDLFRGLLDMIKDLAPHIPDVIDFLRTIATAIGEIAAENGDNIGRMFSTLAKIGKDITPSVVSLVERLAPVVEKILTAIGDFVEKHPDAAVVIGGLALALGKLGLIGPTLSLGFSAAKGVIGWGFKGILKKFDTELVSASNKIQWGKLTSKARVGVMGGFSKISWAGVGRALFGPISAAIVAVEVGHYLMPFVDNIASWIRTSLPDPIKKAFDAVWGIALTHPIFTGLRDGVQGMLDKVWPDRWPWEEKPPPPVKWSKLESSLTDAGKALGIAAGKIGGIFDPIKEQWGTSFTTLDEKMHGALSTWKGILTGRKDEVVTAGKTVMTGLKNSLTTILTGAKPDVDRSTGIMVSGVKPTIQNGLMTVPQEGSKAGRGFADGLGSIKTTVTSVAADLANRAKPKVPSQHPTGKTTTQTFINGLSSLNQAVSNAAAEIARRSKPSTPNLFSSGISIAKSLANGMTSSDALSAVKWAASTVASVTRGYFPFSPAKEGPFSGKGWVLYSGQSIAMAFADGMLSKESEVAKAARTVVTATKREFDGFTPSVGFEAGSVGGMDTDEVASLSANRVSVVVNNYNPVAEKGSTSVNRNVQRLALGGLI